jgi:hypothetical protein
MSGFTVSECVLPTHCRRQAQRARATATGQERTFDNAALIVDNVISFETTDIE